MLTHLKGLEATTESNADGDEYLDAFVFLGGSPNKEGVIEKNLLIAVIKEEFGLTIDMVVSNLNFTDSVGLSAQNRGRGRRHQLLPILCAARRWHQWKPLARKQLPLQ